VEAKFPGAEDAAAWLRTTPADVVTLLRQALAQEPTPQGLRRALYRAQLATGDDLADRSAKRCEDRAYARDFAMAVIASER